MSRGASVPDVRTFGGELPQARSRFLSVEGRVIEDVAELMNTYNDVAMIRRVSSIEDKIKRTKDAAEKKKLEAERTSCA